jgi:hypothetical protein
MLPTEIQVGDRFTDQELEWEVLTSPAALHGGRVLRPRRRRPGLPESEQENTWPVDVIVDIRWARNDDKDPVRGPMLDCRRIIVLAQRLTAAEVQRPAVAPDPADEAGLARLEIALCELGPLPASTVAVAGQQYRTALIPFVDEVVGPSGANPHTRVSPRKPR